MKDIYEKPFLSSWPTPLSFEDIKECFKAKNALGKMLKRKKISSGKGKDRNILRAFWNVYLLL